MITISDFVSCHVYTNVTKYKWNQIQMQQNAKAPKEYNKILKDKVGD